MGELEIVDDQDKQTRLIWTGPQLLRKRDEEERAGGWIDKTKNHGREQNKADARQFPGTCVVEFET